MLIGQIDIWYLTFLIYNIIVILIYISLKLNFSNYNNKLNS